MKKSAEHILCVALGCFLSIGFATAQDDNTKFRLAQAYEQAGDHERAVQIYEELFAKDSSNHVLFDRLRRGYLNLKRYEDAIRLVERRLVKFGRDLNLIAMLGEAKYRGGDEEGAFATWEGVLLRERRNPQAYRLIATYMTQNRLFERAIDVYVRGRENSGDPFLFIAELASLYAVMMNFEQATREHISLLYQNPGQLNYVESRISSYTGKPEGLAAAIRVVEEELESKPEVLWLWHLLAWLHLEGKHFDQAYTVYRTIDKLSEAKGKELFGFADRAFREKAYLVSSRAFRELLQTYPDYERRQHVKYGLARSIGELSRLLADTLEGAVTLEFAPGEPRPSFRMAVDLYSEIAAEQPRSHLSAQSLHQVGLIRFERLFDLDGALDALKQGERAAPGTPTSFDIGVLIGDVWIARGDLSKAEEAWTRLAAHRALSLDYRQKVQFKLAELDYYRGRFDDAVKKLEGLVQKPLLDFANDALLLRTLIEENRMPNEKALELYAYGEFLVKQRKFSQAIAMLEEILTKHSTSFLRDKALMKIAKLQTMMGDLEQAIVSYERLITEFGDESLLLDRARLGIAEIYDFHMKDRQKAIETYQKLLEQSPNSIYAGQARQRIRRLRGDSI